MSIIQISKMQQRAGNLVDLPQLDNGELGWASDANRLFIGRTGSTYSSENIEVLTSYSTVSLSQIAGSDGGNLNINAAENGQILTYVSSTNTWENYTGNSDQLSGGKLNLGDPANITMAGGAIGYVLQTDGTGNLSWTGQTGGNGGGGAPGGANTSVQFNDAGVFGGSANFSFNKTTRVLTLTGNVIANNFVGNLANGTTSIRISPTNGNLTFTSNGNTVMTVATSNAVGIGTTTPNTKLQVIGTIQSTTTTNTGTASDNAQILVSSTNRNGYFQADGNASGSLVFSKANTETGRIYYDNTSNFMAFGVNGNVYPASEKMRIDSNGNVGIGTDAPAYKLEINDENNIGFAIKEYSNVDGATVRGFAALGTKVSPLAVTTGNTLLGLRSFGYNGSAWGTLSGAINIKAAETFTASAQGTSISFSTTPLGSTTLSERVYINTDGNVGIGTDAPGSKLDVRSGYITSGNATSTSGTKILAGYYSSGHLATFGSEYSSGGPILGYAVWPSTSAAGAFVSASPSSLFRGAYTIAGNQHIWYGGAAQTVAINSAVTTSELMRIDSSGNLGIGTNSPSAKLDVRTAAGTSAVMNLYSGSSATQTKFSIGQIGAIDWDIGLTASAGNFLIGGLGGSMAEAYRIARTGTAIDFQTWNTGGSERMRITSSGNVGIGTSSPGKKLQVAGTTDQLSLTTGTNELIVRASSSEAALYTFQAIPLNFYTNNVERMRIDSSGNVGIGTSSPAANNRLTLSDTNSSKLTLTGGSTQNGMLFNVVSTSNQYYIGSGVNLLNSGDKGILIYDATNGRAKFFVEDVAGETRTQATTFLSYYTGASERMRIDSSGNVGIGTSTPSSRLVVNGGTSTSQIRWEVNNAAYTQEVSTNAAQSAYVYKSNDASYHVWKISSTTAMTLDSNSRLLINIATSKTYGGQLQVLNNIQAIGGSSDDSPLIASYDFNALDASPTYASAVLRKFGSTAAGNLYFAAIAAAGWAEIGGINVQSGVAFGANGAVPLVFANSAERMRITSTGAISVGSSGTNIGSSGQVLTSQGNAPPTWTTPTVGTVTSVSGTGTVNGLTLSGSVSTSGSLTLGGGISGSLAGCTVDGTNPVGFLNIPQNVQSSDYITVLGDAGKQIYHPSGAPFATYTIPANSSVAYPIGTTLTFVNFSSNYILVTSTDTLYLSTTSETGSKLIATGGWVTALKITSGAWVLSGTNLTQAVIPGNSGILTSGSSYTLPITAGTSINVLAIAGGGGGGGGSGRTFSSGYYTGGGGGGAGGNAYRLGITVSLQSSVTYTIGGGGAGGTSRDGVFSSGSNGLAGESSGVTAGGLSAAASAGQFGYVSPSGSPGAAGISITGTQYLTPAAGEAAGAGTTVGGFGARGYVINSTVGLSLSSILTYGVYGSGGAEDSGVYSTSGTVYGAGGTGGGCSQADVYNFNNIISTAGTAGAVFIWWGY